MTTDKQMKLPGSRSWKALLPLPLFLLLCSCDWINPAPDFSDAERAIFGSLSLSTLPAASSISNRHVANSSARELGQQLFFDPRLSGTGTISCASCHQPMLGFTDGLPVARAIDKTHRNTPTLLGAAWQTWFYWDGRRDSLWSQALAPIETPAEMGNDRLTAVRFVLNDSNYRPRYENVFGSIDKPLSNYLKNSTEAASPYGDSVTQQNWHRLPNPRQHQINQAFANIGKAIAAYEFTLQPAESRFDKFADAVTNGASVSDDLPLSRTEVAGARLFIDGTKTQCLQCHNGPLFSNGDFHNTDSAAEARPGQPFDAGRTLGAHSMLLDEFNCTGKYSDAKAADCVHITYINRASLGHLQSAFKTPTLRGLSDTGPYFHDGRHASLDEVIQHYAKTREAGTSDLRNDELGKTEKKQLIAFLKSLDAIAD